MYFKIRYKLVFANIIKVYGYKNLNYVKILKKQFLKWYLSITIILKRKNIVNTFEEKCRIIFEFYKK